MSYLLLIPDQRSASDERGTSVDLECSHARSVSASTAQSWIWMSHGYCDEKSTSSKSPRPFTVQRSMTTLRAPLVRPPARFCTRRAQPPDCALALGRTIMQCLIVAPVPPKAE